MQEEDILKISMASVMCLHFSMKEEEFGHPTNCQVPCVYTYDQLVR